MVRLKLIKAKSYMGIVKATEANPYVEVKTADEANVLVESGYFEVAGDDIAVEAKAPETQNASEGNEEKGEEVASQEKTDILKLQQMSKAELVEYAGRNGIDITGCKTKDDISSRIIEMMARAAASREALREE